jgi:hypothetical protein
MKRMYTFETRYFPMIKNSWGWIRKDSSFLELEFTNFKSFGLTFEEIIEFFKSY